MNDLLIGILVFSTLLFLSYVFVLFRLFTGRKRAPSGNPNLFEWHFFIPCRDEEMVIGVTLNDFFKKFPDAHVWVIDDDSEDSTASIITEKAKTNVNIHLVQRRRPEARTGKGNALNAAYAKLIEWRKINRPATPAENVIVGVMDADGCLAANALEYVSSTQYFGDPKVGAGQVAVWMINRDDSEPLEKACWLKQFNSSLLLRMQDIEFRTTNLAMQTVREISGTVGMGGNGQFTRLSTLELIEKEYGTPWHGALAEDYELGLHILLNGYKNVNISETYVEQEAIPHFRRLITQRTRWSQGNMQCVRYIPQIFKSSYFTNFGMLEACYYLLLPFWQVVGGFLMVVATLFGGYELVCQMNNQSISSQQILVICLISIAMWIGPFLIWPILYKLRCEPKASWLRTSLWVVAYSGYVMFIFLCIFRAAFRILFRRNGWLKTRRNSEKNVASLKILDS